MVPPKLALAAGVFAALGIAVTRTVQSTFIESAAANAAVEGLFVGAVVYLGRKALERSASPE